MKNWASGAFQKETNHKAFKKCSEGSSARIPASWQLVNMTELPRNSTRHHIHQMSRSVFPRSAPLQMALVLHRSASDLLLRRRRLYGGSEEVQSGSAQVELSAGLRWWKRAGRRCFLKAADEFDPAYARWVGGRDSRAAELFVYVQLLRGSVGLVLHKLKDR